MRRYDAYGSGGPARGSAASSYGKGSGSQASFHGRGGGSGTSLYGKGGGKGGGGKGGGRLWQHQPAKPPKRARDSDDDDDDDDMPNMSGSSASTSTMAAASVHDIVVRVLNKLIDTRNYTPKACPFSLVRLQCEREGLRGRDLGLYQEFEEQYDVHVKSDKHEEGCACKSTRAMSIAELYHHARDLVRNEGDGARGSLHAAMVNFLETADPRLKAPVDEAQRARASTAQPIGFSEQVSWPPILSIQAKPEFAALLRYKQRVRPLMRNISEATQYFPILGPPKKSYESSSFNGKVLLVFDGKGDEAVQDKLFINACMLRDELNAYECFFVEDRSARFITKDQLEALRGKNVWKDLGGDQFASRLDWRSLGEERLRIEREREEEKQAERLRCEQLESRNAELESKNSQMETELRSLRKDHEESEERHDEFLAKFQELSMGAYQEKVLTEEKYMHSQRVLSQLTSEKDLLHASLQDKEAEIQRLREEAAHAQREREREARLATERERESKAAVAAAVSESFEDELRELKQQKEAIELEKRQKDKQIAEQKEKEPGGNALSSQEINFIITENAELKKLKTILDEMFKKDLRHLVHLEEGRFYLKTMGVLDHVILRRKGLFKLPTQAQVRNQDFTEDQVTWMMEVESWQNIIKGEGWEGETILPKLNAREAFKFKGGLACAVREEDEEVKPNPRPVGREEFINGKWQKWTEYVEGAPIVYRADFFRGLEAAVGSKAKARNVAKYIMEVVNEYQHHSQHTSGYSEIQILWDADLNKEMTPEQKVC